MNSGLPTGLQLHLTITNNGNQNRSMKHGTQRNPVNTSPKDNAEVTHILDHNPMVVHHRLIRHPGTVAGMIGMRTRTGMIHHGKGLSQETPRVA